MTTPTQQAPADARRAALENFPLLPDCALIKGETVCALISCCRKTLWSRVKDGLFPAPVREKSNSIRWRVGDVRKHLEKGDAA